MSLEELKKFRKIVEAIKIAENNIELEQDFRNIDIDKKKIRTSFLNDEAIQKKALERIKYDRRKLE